MKITLWDVLTHVNRAMRKLRQNRANLFAAKTAMLLRSLGGGK
jgi:hypothetical protein